ncbi:MAG TPA: prepilin-type N-terminal cleavage/methylation domain-containing protein [bacterium]|nr:prepilin-type N-terminal cleavage/methylation domain-containing protein [bacterium]HOL48283.1 prepilin-type N-terminal cleavage/methylation domain-containing protein [bacterium]HPQ18736.1 prepilin-type N-terminal cleavage/methylation domain-containing protein [bacterium]
MKKNGLTLIEVIISILVISIIISSIYLFFERGIDLLNITDSKLWYNKNVYNLFNLIKYHFYYSSSDIYCDTNHLYFFSYLNNDTTLFNVRYFFNGDTLYVYNSKNNDTAQLTDFDDVKFNLISPDTNFFDTTLIVSIIYKNKNYQSNFFSIND